MKAASWKRLGAVAFFCYLSCLWCFSWAQESAAREPGQGLHKLSAYFVKSLISGSGLLVLGSTHVYDPRDQQISEIEDQVSLFNPTVILVEGGRRPVAASKEEAVSRFSEMGFAYWLANAKKIPVDDADPDLGAEMRQVAEKHGGELAKLYYALRMLNQFRGALSERTLDEKMEAWLRSRWFDPVPSMAGVIPDLAALDLACKKYLPGLRDWRDMPREWTEATKDASILNEVAKTSAAFRDDYMTSQIVSRYLAGERVILLVGQAHLDAQMRSFPRALADMRRSQNKK